MEYSTWVTLSMCTSFICLTNGTNWSNVHNVPQSIRSSGITIRCHMSAANSKQMETPKNIIKIIIKKKNKKTWMRSVAPVCRFLLFAAYIAQVIAINHPAAIVFRARFTKQICLPVINNSRRLASPALEKYRWITVPVWPPINGRTSISSQLWAPYTLLRLLHLYGGRLRLPPEITICQRRLVKPQIAFVDSHDGIKMYGGEKITGI